MRNSTAAIFLFLFLSAIAWAAPAISDVSGALNETEIGLAVSTRQTWLDRADNNCIDKSSSGCNIRLTVQVSPEGKHPLCKTEETTISSKSISALYCKVISTLDFPEKPAPTSFKLYFNKDSSSQSSGAKISSQSGYVQAYIAPPAPPPCADSKEARDSESVRQCFDQTGGRLNNLYQYALRDNPLCTGTLRLTMQIEANGSVSETRPTVVSGNFDKVFIEKILEAIKSINFGAAAERKEITHDLNFFPN